MIYVNLTGGLGNQLFQYAFARTIQDYSQDQIVASTYEITHFDKNREPNIKNYVLNEKVTFTDDKISWFLDRRGILSKTLRKLSPRMYFKFINAMYGGYIWYEDDYLEISLIKHKNYYVGGYWQSEKYFKTILSELRKEFMPKMICKKTREFEELILGSESVCMHIRRGDYFSEINRRYQVCNSDYYNNALAYILKKLSKPKIFIFSDDKKWVEENINLTLDVVYVEDDHDYLELYLMAKCNHFIISNSSFSWWAQELSDYVDKIVIAPSKWRNDQICADIYNSNWKIISVDQ